MSSPPSSTTNSSGRSSGSFANFFQLPGELRNKIYEFVAYSWISRPFPGRNNSLLPQDDDGISSWDSINLLLVNRRIRGEATRLITEKKVFRLRRLFASGWTRIMDFAKPSHLKCKWTQHLELDYWTADHVLFMITEEFAQTIGPEIIIEPTYNICDCADWHTDAAWELRQSLPDVRTISVTNTKESTVSAYTATVWLLDSLCCPRSRRTLDLLWPRLNDIKIAHEDGSIRLRKDKQKLWILAYSKEPLPAISSQRLQRWLSSVVDGDTGLLNASPADQGVLRQSTGSVKEDDCDCGRRSMTMCNQLDPTAR